MFCYQCEQTARGTGCTTMGVCGKDAVTAALQDYLIYAVKGISRFAHKAAQAGMFDREVSVFVVEALFTTVTNVNFDPETIAEKIREAGKIRDKAKMIYENVCRKTGQTMFDNQGPEVFEAVGSVAEFAKLAESVSLTKDFDNLGKDLAGLKHLLLYGLKGVAAYADHAQILGKESNEVYAEFFRLLDFMADDPRDIQKYIGANMDCGKLNLKVMELLDAANTGAYGNPVPTSVRVTPVKGKAIAVSGHDLKDIEELLKQTEGKGINIYTHGEMLTAHGYPGLKKYKHLAGNYGSAWQNQKKEFDAFPGAILMTTNCIQKPAETYKARIFTSGLVAWPEVKHISDRNFSPVIEAALKAEGFKEDSPEKTIMVGFGHNAVMSVAKTVVEAVKSGAIRHFFLIGGCDGAKPGRNYYTEFAQKVPKDCVILTLACGKYRFNKLDFGDIGGIPRLLDIGQCNDAYSAIQITVALANAFNCGVNDLPLSIILSWYEQKAVAILLTLLSLGIKNIRLGPSLPAFVTPNILDVLVKNFNIAPVKTPEEDLKAILG